MKRVLRTTMMALLAVALFFGMLAPAANAASKQDSDAWNVSIPIKINVTGSQPVAGTYVQFTIGTLTSGVPMPFGSEGSELVWTVPVSAKGITTHNLELSFPELGVFTYTIQMTDGTYTPDKTKYIMEVYSLSDGYEDTVLIYKDLGNDKKEKVESMDFTIALRDLTVAKKWIDQDSSRPSSVEIDLFSEEDDEAVTLKILDNDSAFSTYTFPKVKLSRENSWQSTWTGLDGRKDYWVKEVKIPTGYTASYEYDDENGIWTVTNTGSLLQTGQLNWPIPVLCAAGCLLLAIGVLLMRRKEEENNG